MSRIVGGLSRANLLLARPDKDEVSFRLCYYLGDRYLDVPDSALSCEQKQVVPREAASVATAMLRACCLPGLLIISSIFTPPTSARHPSTTK